MELVNVRVDSRGIHGQVVTSWVRVLDIGRIVVVDDEVIHNVAMKKILKMACPEGVKLSILDVETALARLNDDAYPGERVMMILLRPETLATFAEQAFYFDEVILGNVSRESDSVEVARTVYLKPEDRDHLLGIAEKTHFYYQMVPTAKKELLFVE